MRISISIKDNDKKALEAIKKMNEVVISEGISISQYIRNLIIAKELKND